MTMTLAQLITYFRSSPVAGIELGAVELSLHAAIRERGELRGKASYDLATVNGLCRDIDALKDRAERAEAELTALKARIADAPVASVRVDDRMHVSIGARSNAVDFVPLHTKRVRLLVED